MSFELDENTLKALELEAMNTNQTKEQVLSNIIQSGLIQARLELLNETTI